MLCISDHVDSLIYSPALKDRFGDVDAVISCGDLKQNYYEFIVSTLNIPLLYVLGNHSEFSLKKNIIDYSGPYGEQQGKPKLFNGGILADGRCIYLKELNLITAGFGGSAKYNNGDNQYTEFEMFIRILKIIPKLLFNKLFRGRYIDILITHAPPRHINDLDDRCHRGFRVFRWFIRRFKPAYMLHGHIHLYKNTTERFAEYKGVPVINTYKHHILELSADGGIDEPS
ncbi:MAG: metallophosphoesterase [Spirochaetales bacterium]|uniref:Metallophosphoesterase n=1 Tax=Candidatus Thalassospirochaeta sargassi TaxID=3119039 RepID=A0AAJ1ICE9_9SPIO|nr:metallophosphoesterase [Spirochaetales bacterium]